VMRVGGAGFFRKSTTISILESIELQVFLTTPGHQMVNLLHVGRLNEGGFIRKLQELDRLMTGGAGIRVQREEWWGKDTALSGTGADGPGVRDVFPQPHVLLPVGQEVCDPPAGGVRHAQLGEIVLQQSRLDSNVFRLS